MVYVLVFRLWGMWDLSCPTGARTHTPCIGRQSLKTTGPPRMYLAQSHTAWDSDSGGSYATPGALSKTGYLPFDWSLRLRPMWGWPDSIWGLFTAAGPAIWGLMRSKVTMFTARWFTAAKKWKHPSVHQQMMDKQNVAHPYSRTVMY